MKAAAYRAPLLEWIPGLKIALVVALAGGIVAGGTWTARIRMEREQARRALCAAQLEAVLARNLFVERYVRPADPCLALEVAAYKVYVAPGKQR